MRFRPSVYVFLLTLTISISISDASPATSDLPAATSHSLYSSKSSNPNPTNPTKTTIPAHKPLTNPTASEDEWWSHNYTATPYTGPSAPKNANNTVLWKWMSDTLMGLVGEYSLFTGSPNYTEGVPDRFPQWIDGWERMISNKEEWERWVGQKGYKSRWRGTRKV
jgi:hypothetical protein